MRGRPGIGWSLFLASFVYYGLRAAAGPAWLDGSEFAATSHLLAVPHPTGSPLYLVLAKLVQQLLPVGPPAVRLAWLSALFAALAVERLFAIAAALTARIGARTNLEAALATALFALTPGMLAIGHRAELYSLQTWLGLAVVRLALHVRDTQQPGDTRLAGLCIGLAAATHPYLTLLFVPGALLLAGRSIVRPRVLVPTLGFVLLAGTSYGILALRGRAGGIIGWGDATTWSGWIDILLARAFQKSVTAPMSSAGLEDLVLFLVSQLGTAGGLLVPLLALAGAVVLARRLPIVAAGVGLIIVLGFASRGLWRFDQTTPDTAGYFALATAMTLALVAVALARASIATRTWWQAARSGSTLPAGLEGAIAIGVAAALAASIGLPARRELEGDVGREVGLRVLAPIEPGAVVVLDDFNLLFMIWYLQAVEGVRPDVQVVFGGFLSQPWYRERLDRVAPALAAQLQHLDRPMTTALYVDYGLGARRLPERVRTALRPAGLLLRAGDGRAPPSGARDWLVGRDDLDLQTRRALIWLHFRQACFHFERHDATAWKWHADAIEELQPGVGLGPALGRGDPRVCEGGGT
jgi:hypothetical protein